MDIQTHQFTNYIDTSTATMRWNLGWLMVGLITVLFTETGCLLQPFVEIGNVENKSYIFPKNVFDNAIFFLIFHSIYDYYILAGGFNSTRIVENVRDGLIQDGQQIHVFMISTIHGDTLYLKLTLSLKLKKDLVFGASRRIYILNFLICAFTTHVWRCICCIYILKTFLHTAFIKLNYFQPLLTNKRLSN